MLALDAASPALLKSWAADGTLPNIARLMSGGLVGDTRSVEALYGGATWPSFYTALNPAGHGVYWLEQPKGGTYRIHRCGAGDFGRRKALWEVLSDAGRRVVVLDVPLSRRSPRLNGVQTVEWGTHDAAFGFQATPDRLKRDIRRTIGRHPAPSQCDAPRRDLTEYRAFADQLVDGVAARVRLTRRLLTEKRWDFAIQVFSEAHCAGHQLWHFHDAMHPGYNPDDVRSQGDLVRSVYIALDTAIGDLTSSLDAETTLVLLTLHGMSYMAGSGILMPELLTRLGLMSQVSGRQLPASGNPGARLAGGLRTAYHLLPQGIRQPAYDLRHYVGERWFNRGSPMNLDPQRSKCFSIGLGPSCSGIRLNVKGREPQGTLAPGADAERFSSQLIDQLFEFREFGTDRPLVARVIRAADRFSGRYLEELPDLVVEWDLEQAVGSTVVGTGAGAMLRGYSGRAGLIERINTYCRSGDHRVGGMFIAHGPGITPGEMDRVVSNLDLAPSFARFLGCEMPSVDGQPIRELSGQ